MERIVSIQYTVMRTFLTIHSDNLLQGDDESWPFDTLRRYVRRGGEAKPATLDMHYLNMAFILAWSTLSTALIHIRLGSGGIVAESKHGGRSNTGHSL